VVVLVVQEGGRTGGGAAASSPQHWMLVVALLPPLRPPAGWAGRPLQKVASGSGPRACNATCKKARSSTHARTAYDQITYQSAACGSPAGQRPVPFCTARPPVPSCSFSRADGMHARRHPESPEASQLVQKAGRAAGRKESKDAAKKCSTWGCAVLCSVRKAARKTPNSWRVSE
jgi:hypothetical protein